MRKLCRLITATFLIVAIADSARDVLAQNDATEARAIYREAQNAYNAQKWQDAKSILIKLIESHPGHYQGHGLYWEVVGWTDDEAARRAAVVRSLKQFEEAPPEKRNEDFYFHAVKGYEILEDKARVGALKKEAIVRFPRGSMAQSARLDAAREEKDPAKSAAMYQSYIDEFNDNVSWSQIAASGKLTLIARRGDIFDAKALLAAAEQLERFARRFIGMIDDPYRYISALHEIAGPCKRRTL